MADEGFKRKLTAILSADVAGYSRLMAEDEAATVKILADYREVIASLTKQHHGRVVDSPGDNILAEFASVVDAVQCAVAVQKELETRNADLDENRRMEFRIGINLGDVIDEKERIYGDGVNIAARLEALSDPGGICISKTAFDQIETKLPLGYEFLGEQEVKNIPKPVPAYRVLMDVEAAGKVIGKYRSRTTQLRWTATGGLMVLMLVVGAWAIWNFYFRVTPPPGLELPDRPSIAVLPFKNLSSDQQQGMLGEGFAVSIVTQLYKVPNVFVIARQSSFKYKDEAVKVQQIGRELGVQYVLEGSVQREGDQIRINAQLIDTATGNHLWAETYDRKVKDVFALQDEIVRKVITEMAVEVAWGEMAREMTHATENVEALNLYFNAEKLWQRFEKEPNLQARKMLEKAIALDPKYARAIAFLGYTYSMEAGFGWTKNRKQSIKRAEKLAKQALAINECVYLGRILLGGLYAKRGLYNQAIAEGEKAVECEPNNALAKNSLAGRLSAVGRLDEALVLSKKALRMAPYPPPYVLSRAGEINYLLGRFEAAISHYQTLFERFPSRRSREAPWLIASYMALEQEKTAKTEVQKLLKKYPGFSFEKFIKREKRSDYKDKSYIERQVELLRKAGLK